MNVLIPLPDGSMHCLTPHECEILHGFLFERMAHGPEQDQAAILRMREHLRLAMTPEAQYGACYEPHGYQPGWQQAA